MVYKPTFTSLGGHHLVAQFCWSPRCENPQSLLSTGYLNSDLASPEAPSTDRHCSVVVGMGIPTMWGPQDSVQLVNITPMSLWFMVLITIVTEAYLNQLVFPLCFPSRGSPPGGLVRLRQRCCGPVTCWPWSTMSAFWTNPSARGLRGEGPDFLYIMFHDIMYNIIYRY